MSKDVTTLTADVESLEKQLAEAEDRKDYRKAGRLKKRLEKAQARKAKAEEKARAEAARIERRARRRGGRKRKEALPQEIAAVTAPGSAQELIPYQLLHRDGVMRIDDGHYSITLDVDDVNYLGAREEDQEDKRDVWRRYLDSLDPSIEVKFCAYNRRIRQSDFEDSILFDPVPGDDTANLMREELNAWCEQKLAAAGARTMRRRRVAVITVAAPTYEKAAPELAREAARLRRCIQDLDSDARVLDGQGVLDVLRAFTHQDDAEGTALFDSVADDPGLTTRDLVAPTRVLRSAARIGDSRLIVGNRWCRTLTILTDGYGTHMRDDFITDILELPYEVAVTWAISPWETSAAISTVERQLRDVRTENNAYKLRESRPASGYFIDDENLPLSMKDAEEAARESREDIVKRQMRYFGVVTCILCQGKNEDELEAACHEVEGVFSRHNKSLPDSWSATREQAFATALPIGGARIPYVRNLTSDPLSHMHFFASAEMDDDQGIIMGVNSQTRNFIVYDPVKYEHTNSFVLALPRAGKSFNLKITKLLQTRLRHPEDDIITIDPEREYQNLTQLLGGEVIRISETSPDRINPLEISAGYGSDNPDALANPVPAKVSFVKALFHMMAPSITDAQINVLDSIASLAYSKWMETRSDEDIPTLGTIYDMLLDRESGSQAARDLAELIGMYVTGTLSAFNGPTTADLENHLICFDIADLSTQLKPIALLVLMDHIWVRVTKNREAGRRTWLFIDEYQLLLDDEYATDQFDRLFTRGGKWDLYEVALTQNVSRILDNEKALYMLQNSPCVTLLGQSPDSARELGGFFTLSDSQVRSLRTAQPGEGLYIFRNRVIPFDFTLERSVCPTIYDACTTKPSDRQLAASERRRGGAIARVARLEDELRERDAEIERLRAAVSDAEEKASQLAARDAEIERLRAAATESAAAGALRDAKGSSVAESSETATVDTPRPGETERGSESQAPHAARRGGFAVRAPGSQRPSAGKPVAAIPSGILSGFGQAGDVARDAGETMEEMFGAGLEQMDFSDDGDDDGFYDGE